MIGSIPEKLKIFLRSATEVESKFDDSEILVCENKLVSPAFISDAVNKKTCQTGEYWAKGYNNKYTTEEVDNIPIKNVVITGLEKRGNGGRAYKVIVNDKYYVDLREDVLLECMLSSGITPGGKLNGEYIWAKVGSEMKLVRVNSGLYHELVKNTLLTDVPKIKKLEIGRVYKSKTKSAVYLGEFSNIEITVITDNPRGSTFFNVFKYNNKVDVSLKKQKKLKMFYEYNDTSKKSIEYDYVTRYSMIKDHSFKIETDIKIKLDDNWLNTFKNTLITQFRSEHGDLSQITDYRKLGSAIDYLIYYSRILNINETELHPLLVNHINIIKSE